jgi:hypothetical protein
MYENALVLVALANMLPSLADSLELGDPENLFVTTCALLDAEGGDRGREK